MKYKKGQIVEVKSNQSGHEFSIGEFIKIITVEETDYLAEGLSGRWWITDAELKKPKGLKEEKKVSRKDMPVYSGVLKYFPDAILELSKVSKAGNDQHNPGTPLHWDRSKSTDELDALARHLIDAGTLDTDGIKHSAKVAWRALANLQKEIENDRTVRETKEKAD